MVHNGFGIMITQPADGKSLAVRLGTGGRLASRDWLCFASSCRFCADPPGDCRGRQVRASTSLCSVSSVLR